MCIILDWLHYHFFTFKMSFQWIFRAMKLHFCRSHELFNTWIHWHSKRLKCFFEAWKLSIWLANEKLPRIRKHRIDFCRLQVASARRLVFSYGKPVIANTSLFCIDYNRVDLVVDDGEWVNLPGEWMPVDASTVSYSDSARTAREKIR